MHPSRPGGRTGGFTLLELLLVIALMAIIATTALPRVHRAVDHIGARGAADDAEAVLDRARALPLARWTRATVAIDTVAGTLTLVVGPDTVLRRDERAAHGVRLHATRGTVTYTPLGMGFGVSNLTLVATRGAAAETVTVSRLGRVRR